MLGIISNIVFVFLFANPLLIAEPLESVDYYVLIVDGKEFTAESSVGDLFVFDLEYLKDGKHFITIISQENGGKVSFNLRKKTTKNYVKYKLDKRRPIIIWQTKGKK